MGPDGLHNAPGMEDAAEVEAEKSQNPEEQDFLRGIQVQAAHPQCGEHEGEAGHDRDRLISI
jgi:hypothetical protein